MFTPYGGNILHFSRDEWLSVTGQHFRSTHQNSGKVQFREYLSVALSST